MTKRKQPKCNSFYQLIILIQEKRNKSTLFQLVIINFKYQENLFRASKNLSRQSRIKKILIGTYIDC